MKEIERSLADSRQSWTTSVKAIEEDVRQLKGVYNELLDNDDGNEFRTTAKTASASRNTTCRRSRILLETNDHLLRLLSIMMEELKRRPTS